MELKNNQNNDMHYRDGLFSSPFTTKKNIKYAS